MKNIYFKYLTVLTFSFLLNTVTNISVFAGEKKIIIVGAGISGLSAAQYLKNADSSLEILILEAKDHIGGRAYTVKTEDLSVDLGASWIHGLKHNPITSIAKKLNLKVLSTDDVKRPITYLDAPQILSAHERMKIDDVYEEFKEYAKTNTPKAVDFSLASAYSAYLRKALPKLSQIDESKLRHILVSETENDFGTEAENISFKNWDSGYEFGGGNGFVKDGMGSIAKYLADGLEIKLNQKVTSVNWLNDKIIVKTADKAYAANQLIITASLGALKKNQILFNPDLPAWKKEAMARLGFGQFSKVYLVFRSVFWPNTHKWIENIGSNPHVWPMFLNLNFFMRKPILLALHVGNQARRIDSLDEELLKDEVYILLKKIWGDKAQRPMRIYRSNWSNDAENFGAYSYPAVGSNSDDYELVGQAVEDKLFFAGEATHSDHSATVHAAYESGMSAAQAILKIYEKSKEKK